MRTMMMLMMTTMMAMMNAITMTMKLWKSCQGNNRSLPLVILVFHIHLERHSSPYSWIASYHAQWFWVSVYNINCSTITWNSIVSNTFCKIIKFKYVQSCSCLYSNITIQFFLSQYPSSMKTHFKLTFFWTIRREHQIISCISVFSM